MPEQIFTIVVADDEDELREAVCRLIDWEGAGFKLVGSAGNGLEALQLVEQLQPDLLLTDIQMPFIKGTELAHQVRELQPLIQVAFLSGYDDFEYARSAIDERVIAYLLKPINIAGLTEELKRIHGVMENIFRAFAPSDSADPQLSLAAASALLDSNAGRMDSGELAESLKAAGMRIPDFGDCSVLALSVEGKRFLPQSLAQTVDKVLGRSFACASFASGGRIFSLVCGVGSVSELDEALDELYYVVKRLTSAECVIGVSLPFTDLSGCVDACRQAAEVCRRSESFGHERYGGSSAGGMGELINKALRIIDSRYMDEDLSLNSVSAELHVSPNYLSANMKKYAGDTFINLLIKRRMEASRQLISSGSMKIGEVAERCGYGDQHYFSYCFKKYFGVSPVQMRRREESKA